MSRQLQVPTPATQWQTPCKEASASYAFLTGEDGIELMWEMHAEVVRGGNDPSPLHVLPPRVKYPETSVANCYLVNPDEQNVHNVC